MAAADKFFLVPKIVAAEKYIDISRDEIERTMNEQNGEFDIDWEEVVVDDFAVEHEVTLKLNISCRSQLMEGWSVALKLHGIRIDGIDWHNRFRDPEGNTHHGWHRHRFDQKARSANNCRWPTAVLDGASDRTQFLIRTLKELNILFSGVDHGNYELFSD